MREIFVTLVVFVSFFGCKRNEYNKEDVNTNDIVVNSKIIKDSSIIFKQESRKILLAKVDFSNILESMKSIKHTGEKHKDWMSNHIGFTDKLIGLSRGDIKIQTTSYEFKDNCKFYLHILSHTNDKISIRPFLEKAQGKITRGYTQNKVLLFAMKNNKVANFIDIPEKLNPLKLREELVALLYQNIDSDIILCDRTKECVYKDLRKN